MEIKEFGGYVISFKSLPEFYELERDGLKSNTIRELNGDERKAFIEWSKKDGRIIEIINTETGESFRRFVTHVHSPTFDQALISWKHPGYPASVSGEKRCVKDIVICYLKSVGADGLCCPWESCGCGIDDLCPCCENPLECLPAKKIPVPEDMLVEFDKDDDYYEVMK